MTQTFLALMALIPSTNAPAEVTTGAWRAVFRRHPMEPRCGRAMIAVTHRHDRDEAGIADHIDPGVGEFQRAAVGRRIHGA